MEKSHKSSIFNLDMPLLIMYLVIAVFGLMNIYATTFAEGNDFFDFSQRYLKQFQWMIVSCFFVLLFFMVNLRAFSFAAYPVYGFFIFVLRLVLAVGSVMNGGKSWIVIGSFSVQPAEFAKFSVALALAKYLSNYNVKLTRFKDLMISFAIVFIPAALVLLQNDTGSALVYFTFLLVLYVMGMSQIIMWLCLASALLFITTLMLPLHVVFIGLIVIGFIAHWFFYRNYKTLISGAMFTVIPVWLINETFNIALYFSIGGGMLLSSLFYLIYAYRSRLNKIYYIIIYLYLSVSFCSGVDYSYNKFLSPHQRDRIEILLGLKTDPRGVGYNVEQSKIAIGSGGFFGKGFLNGTQTKFDFVPEQSTDFIFCTVGEEWGFWGSALLVILYVSFLLRIMVVAVRQRSVFSRIYGYCVVAILFFHFFVNIGMTLGLLPVIGIPLPFFSYGGSSFLAFTMLFVLFIRLDASRLEVLQ